MFPCFYKSCILYDMDRYQKEQLETTIIPFFYFIRKILFLLEVFGLF